jgi:CRP/FNR family transcriptional regulator
MHPKSNVVNITNLRTSLKDHQTQELCLPLDLPEEDLRLLGSIVRKHYLLQPGEHLYNIGDPGKAIYAVRSGTIKTYIPTDQGDEQVLGFYLPRELLGFEALGHDNFSSAAMAVETSDVCELPFDSLEKLYDQVKGLREQIDRLIGREFYNDHTMLLLLGKRHGEERLASFLLSISRRLQNRGFSPKEFNLTMSRRDIGNYLGLAEETVSRLFTRFQEEGIVRVERKHLTIHDMDKLQAMVEH